MKDKPKEELWLTPKDLADHIKSMNEKAEKEYHEKTARTLGAQIEGALIPNSDKH